MPVIKEINKGKNTIYLKTFSSDPYSKISVINISKHIAKIDGKEFLMLYDSNMSPITDAIRYINYHLNNDSSNTRLLAQNALKFLYSFFEAFNCNMEDLDNTHCQMLIDFLRGVSKKGLTYTLELTTPRQSATIDSYLKVYRGYAKFLNLDDLYFLQSRTSLHHNGNIGYRLSVKTEEPLTTPDYIKIPEYLSMLNYLFQRKDQFYLRDTIILRLQFEYGLRIGEILGLTLEDFVIKSKNDIITYHIIIRNRASDSEKGFQNSKSVITVNSKSDYNIPEYRTRGIGYHNVLIKEDLAQQIIEYTNTAHYSSNSKYMERRNSSSMADSVSGPKNKDVSTNYYIFLNTWGRVLRQSNWNTHLRNIFTAVGIPVDKDKRKNNLNHRLRHGYAHILQDQLGLDQMQIKELLRHKSVSSTMIYTKPTEERLEELQASIIPDISSLLT